MSAQTPLVLLDNVFDVIGLYPSGVIATSSEVVGREGFRVADYRRDRTWWQPTTDGGGADNYVRVQLGAAAAIDSVWLDRGHNLGGRTVYLEGSPDGATWSTSLQLNVPNAVGGTPAQPAMCQTEEGAAWTLFNLTTARLFWRLRVPYSAGFVPVVPGIIAGARTQLLGYSSTFDEDAGGRTTATQQSTAGYLASDTTYAWRTVTLDLKYIGAAEYDSTMRKLRDLMFAKNQPWFCAMDYGTRPERGWLYQFDGASWAMAKQRVYRSGRITGREVGPVLA